MQENKKFLSQEALKIIACLTMLIDHIGVVFFPKIQLLRIIGRIAFPIFCFLLVEGVYHTKYPVRYGFRLFIGMLLAELPFDFLFFGGLTWEHQSVMVTLLLAYIMLQCIMRITTIHGQLLIFPFIILAEILHTDYGAFGICLVALFMITRKSQYKLIIQVLSICLLSILYFSIYSIEPFCILALPLIGLYSGKKMTHNKIVQLAFYSFYSVHLILLLLVFKLIN